LSKTGINKGKLLLYCTKQVLIWENLQNRIFFLYLFPNSDI